MRAVVAGIAVSISMACAGAGAAQPQPGASPPAAAAVPAPCEDFHAYANAAWLAGEGTSANVFADLQALSLSRQRALLDALAAAPAGDVERQLGTFWRAATDEAGIEAAGTAAVRPWLERIDEVRKPADLAELVARAHAAGLPLLFRFDVGADLREPDRTVVYARQGGLGLPDRDYYLREDPSTEALRTHYRAYVARLLALSGTPRERIEADVAAVMDIESRLARASLSLVQLRDPNNSWLPSGVDDVDDRYRHLDWKGFLRAQGLRKLRGISLAHTSFFVEADHLAGALPIGHWRAYLRFHLVHALAEHLPSAFRDAHFALFGRQLQGLEAPPERWQVALRATDGALGEWLGERYAARYLDAAAATRARAIVDGLVAALRRRLAAADWLSAEARAAGARKLDALRIAVGHDDPPPTGKLAALSATDHAANMLAIAAWRRQDAFARLGEKPRAPALRGHRVNAFYAPGANLLAVSAAFLAPPLLPAVDDHAVDGHAVDGHVADDHGVDGNVVDGHAADDQIVDGGVADNQVPDDDVAAGDVATDAPAASASGAGAGGADAARAWGALGTLLGHELSHAVDLQGAGIGADGVAGSWWSAADFQQFTERTRALAAQYDAYAALADVKVDGRRTFVENVADLAGLELAWDAFRAAAPAAGAAAHKRFFEAYAQVWRERVDPRVLRLAQATGVHAPARWRVLGTLANFAPFAETYGCTAGEHFLQPAPLRIRVWH